MTRRRRDNLRAGGYGSSWIRPERRRAIYLRDKWVCAYCQEDTRKLGGPTLDHVDPRGGDHEANLVVACRPCNNRKADLPVPAFAVLLGLTPHDTVRLNARINRRRGTSLTNYLPVAKADIAAERSRRDLARFIVDLLDANGATLESGDELVLPFDVDEGAFGETIAMVRQCLNDRARTAGDDAIFF